MNDLIGLVILILFALGAYLGLRYLSKPKKITAEQFEKNLDEGPSLVDAGMMELQKFLDPRAANSVVAAQELKQGRYNKKKDQGDGKGDDGDDDDGTVN